MLRDFRQGPIDVVFRQVEPADRVRKQFEPDIGMNSRLKIVVLFFRLFGGAADDRIEPRHDFERLRWAPVFGHASFEVAVEFLRAGKAVLWREHAFGEARCDFAANFR